ncbi:Gldg family protein [Pseudobacter ginsenosidimutans]|uniref:ABC-2 type transport system permease protein n=1 Tax=Pseudobacter ginsenosidimutans TaxID=661488 RepID=A0A4Q7N520_9BACT|nr:Gldg family protein [Pseudobacter ginsenosidimutans]QEC44630.1 ABC transporter permease subunit [Pseudobacter ginsenosidimutans]RZS76111.1 ABC-2 type transport system permease protein [Pseudobacter ginsenosidimutans]
MRIIFKIARAELRTLFYSPVAWITIVVFFVISGIQFVTPLQFLAIKQELKIANSPSFGGFPGPLTLKLFLGTIGQFLQYLYLFIPLLTMGVINREENSGTMKLLSSSPVRIREIVLGKYTGLMLFNLVLMSAITFLLFTGYFTILHAEFSWYLSMLLGFFLLSSTYMAIGLFISSLTGYQIVAGIATFAALFVLSYMGNVLQQYDFIRDITWFLSLSGRVDPMIKGLITTRELFYFFLIIVLFLGLTMIRLKSKQESKKWTVTFSRNMALICTILMLGYFSSRPGYIGYLDVTRNKLNTIDTATQAVLKEMDGSQLTVTMYGNLLGRAMEASMPEKRNEYVWYFWDQYVRFYPNIKLKYVNYYDIKPGETMFQEAFPGKDIHQIAAQFAKIFKKDTAAFMKPHEVRKLIDLSREDKLGLLMELEYKGKKSILRTFQGTLWPEQPVVSGSIRRLTRPPVPKLLFTTGHYERSPWRNGEREFGPHTNEQERGVSLINYGMDCDTINLLHQEIPAATAVLVVGDPRSALQTVEQEKIKQFIAKGGNVYFYGEPEKQAMLNPLLNGIGVHLNEGRLVQPAQNATTDALMAAMNKTGNGMSRELAMQGAQLSDSTSGAGGSFWGTCDLSFKDTAGFRVEPILEIPGEKNLWVENGLFKADSAKPLFSPAEGDLQKDIYTTGVRLTRKINNKEQRIVVTSDADFMASRTGVPGGSIGAGIYSWLVYNEYPVYTRLIVPKDVMLTIGKQAGNMIWYMYVYVLPGALLLTGIIILIRRRRK